MGFFPLSNIFSDLPIRVYIENRKTNLLYGGSFKRFMQVADVGNRSSVSSEALPAALYDQSIRNFIKFKRRKEIF